MSFISNKQVLIELNKCRNDPSNYSANLEKTLQFYKGKIYQRPGKPFIETKEGPANVLSCIKFLKSSRPVHGLLWSTSLYLAAEAHVKDIGPKGLVGHTSSDGTEASERISKYCEWSGSLGENIAYGFIDVEDIIVSLLVDDGVLARGQRLNIMKRDFNYVGIALGQHSEYGLVCVIVFSEEIRNKNEPKIETEQKLEVKNFRWSLKKMKTVEAYETFDEGLEKTDEEQIWKTKEMFDCFEKNGKIGEGRSVIDEREISELSAFHRYLDRIDGKKLDPNEFLEVMTENSEVSFELSKSNSVSRGNFIHKKLESNDYENPLLSRDCFLNIKECFDAVDFERSGFVSSSDLKSQLQINYSSNSDILLVLNELEKEKFSFPELLGKIEKKQPPKPKTVKKQKFDPRPFIKEDLAEEEIIELKEAFDMFDTEGNGVINPTELKSAMENQGLQIKSPTIFHMISCLDFGSEKCVNFEGFLDMATNQELGESSEEEVKKLFNIFDVEKSGFIELKNLKRIARELGESLNEREIIELFTQSDLDGDGKVSFHDFFSIMNHMSKH